MQAAEVKNEEEKTWMVAQVAAAAGAAAAAIALVLQPRALGALPLRPTLQKCVFRIMTMTMTDLNLLSILPRLVIFFPHMPCISFDVEFSFF